MPWMPFLLKWWRVGLYGLAALLVALAVWRVVAWRAAYQALPAAQEALQAEIDCGEGSRCRERLAAAVAAQEARQAAISTQVVESYEAEMESLRSRPAVRRVIRVCPEATDRDLRHAVAAGPADGAGPAAGGVPGPIEFDTGALRDLARDADEVAARLRALQQWNEALSQPAAQ